MARSTSTTSAGSAEEGSELGEVLDEVGGEEDDGDVEAGEEEEGEAEVGKMEPEEASADLGDREGVTVEELPLPSRKAELSLSGGLIEHLLESGARTATLLESVSSPGLRVALLCRVADLEWY